jgi:hypothetical protein
MSPKMRNSRLYRTRRRSRAELFLLVKAHSIQTSPFSRWMSSQTDIRPRPDRQVVLRVLRSVPIRHQDSSASVTVELARVGARPSCWNYAKRALPTLISLPLGLLPVHR